MCRKITSVGNEIVSLLEIWLKNPAKMSIFPDHIHWWGDYYIRFVLDQHSQLGWYSASLLKQLSARIYITQLLHIILIQSETVFALTP
jgi:hypothetical protein